MSETKTPSEILEMPADDQFDAVRALGWREQIEFIGLCEDTDLLGVILSAEQTRAPSRASIVEAAQNRLRDLDSAGDLGESDESDGDDSLEAGESPSGSGEDASAEPPESTSPPEPESAQEPSVPNANEVREGAHAGVRTDLIAVGRKGWEAEAKARDLPFEGVEDDVLVASILHHAGYRAKTPAPPRAIPQAEVKPKGKTFRCRALVPRQKTVTHGNDRVHLYPAKFYSQEDFSWATAKYLAEKKLVRLV